MIFFYKESKCMRKKNFFEGSRGQGAGGGLGGGERK